MSSLDSISHLLAQDIACAITEVQEFAVEIVALQATQFLKLNPGGLRGVYQCDPRRGRQLLESPIEFALVANNELTQITDIRRTGPGLRQIACLDRGLRRQMDCGPQRSLIGGGRLKDQNQQ